MVVNFLQKLNNNIRTILINAYEDGVDNFRNFELLNKPISISNLIVKGQSYVK
jgi:hypothetical protein